MSATTTTAIIDNHCKNHNSKKEFRWGIVSTAKIAQDLMNSLRLQCPDAKVVAVCSRNQEKAEAFGKANNIPHCYDSVDKLIADTEVDCVYVCSLNPFHKEPVIKALKAGKPVLCEKPFCLNARDAEEMIKVAREEKVFLMEAMWTRYFPIFTEMTRLITAGAIGDVVSVRGQFGFGLNEERDVSRLVSPELGGGALMDIGIYLVSFVYGIFREYPSGVKAFAKMKGGVDWHDSIVLEFEKGHAILDCGFDSDYYETDMFIVGTKGSIHVPNPFFAPTKIILKNEKGEEVIERPKLENDHPWNFSESVGLFHEVKYMQEALKQGKLESDILSLDETHKIMKLMDQIRKEINLIYPWEK